MFIMVCCFTLIWDFFVRSLWKFVALQQLFDFITLFPVGDECVNDYVSSDPHADYFLNLVKFFREQCISLNTLALDASK